MARSGPDFSDPLDPRALVEGLTFSLQPPETDMGRFVTEILPKLERKFRSTAMSDGDIRRVAHEYVRHRLATMFCEWRREDVPGRAAESASFLKDLLLPKDLSPECREAFDALDDIQVEVYLLFGRRRKDGSRKPRMGVERIARTLAIPREVVEKYLDEVTAMLEEKLSGRARRGSK